MAKEVLETIMNVQPKDAGGGGGETRETVVYRQADDMLGKLPPDYAPHEVYNGHCVSKMQHKYYLLATDCFITYLFIN